MKKAITTIRERVLHFIQWLAKQVKHESADSTQGSPLTPQEHNNASAVNGKKNTEVTTHDEILELPKAAVHDESLEPSEVAAHDESIEPPEVATHDGNLELPKVAAQDESIEPPEVAAQDESIELPKVAAQDESIEPPEVAAQDEILELPKVAAQDENLEPPEVAAHDGNLELPKVAAQDENLEPPEVAAQDGNLELPKVAAHDENLEPPEVAAQDGNLELPKVAAHDESIEPPEVAAHDGNLELPKVAAHDENLEPPEVAAHDGNLELPKVAAHDESIEPPEVAAHDEILELPKVVAHDKSIEPPEVAAHDGNLELPKVAAHDENLEPPEVATHDGNLELPKAAAHDENLEPPEVAAHDGNLELPKVAAHDENLDPPEVITRDENPDLLEATTHDKSLEPPEVAPHDGNLESPKVTPPANHPGRRLEPSWKPTRHSDKRGQDFDSRSELICRNTDRQWEIILSTQKMPEATEVQHDGKPLHSDDGEYRISCFRGNISIEANGKREIFHLFDGSNPLIFKLKKNWTGDGRQIRYLTQGYFIVFALEGWEPTGQANITHEPCRDTTFFAHYFNKDKGTGSEIGSVNKYGGLPVHGAGFELCGKRLFDDSEEGELFATDPPEIKLAPGTVWARVGEELRNGWGENFKPADRLLGDVLGDRQGRFYIRVYDAEGKLVDSEEFRYCANLQAIQVNGEPYSQDIMLAPDHDGYSETTLKFLGADGEAMHPSMTSTHAVVGSEGIVMIPPCPEGDETSFTLASKKGSVDVVIKLPRIWWRIEQDKNQSQVWHDTPLVKTRQEFRQYARENAVVCLRLPSRINEVNVGFDEDLNRILHSKDQLRFQDFVDDLKIENPLEKDAELRIRYNDVSMVIIRITADPTPTPPAPPPVLLPPKRLHPQVKKGNGSGLRHGKGFSCCELQGAGFNESDASNLGIRIDRRRRSAHQINIDTIERIE